MRLFVFLLGALATAHAAPPPVPPADTELSHLLAQVSPARLRQRVDTLAAFGTEADWQASVRFAMNWYFHLRKYSIQFLAME